MANKKISELAVRTPSLTDLMLVGDPSTGYSYKATLSALSTLLEANIALDDLNDVTITSPTAGQVLSYNGTAWVNDTNGITGSGTTNYVPKFTSSSVIGNSQIFDNGTNVGIGTTTPDSTARIEISKTDGYGLYINYTTNTGVAPTATGLYVINNTNLYGYSAVIEEKTPNTNTGQIPLLIKSSLSSGTVATGFATGIHFETPDDAGTFKRAQLSVDITNAVASTFSTRFRFNVRHNDISTNVFYIAGNGIGIFRNTPTAALDVNGDVKISNIPNATTDTDIFLVSDGGVIKYRTGSEVLSDIGGAAASSISGTTNYIPKFTSSSAIGNSVIYESSGDIFLGSGYVLNRANNKGYFTGTGDNLGMYYDGTNSIISSSTGSLTFSTSGSERMRLTATGYLIVGGTSNAELARIKVDNGYLFIKETNGGDLYLRSGYGVNTDPAIQVASADPLLFVTNNTEKMRITSGGNVGIGVTNPDSYNGAANQLVVSGGSLGGLTIAATTEGGIYFADGTTGAQQYAGAITYVHTSDALLFYSNATERMRITSGGELLINTTSDAGDYKLQVNGNVYAGNGYIQTTEYFISTKTANNAYLINSTGANYGTIQNDSANTWSLGYGASTTTLGTSVIKWNSSNETILAGSIKTAAPSGGTAKPFKIGAAATVTPTSQNRTIEIEIDGTTYYLTAKTTND